MDIVTLSPAEVWSLIVENPFSSVTFILLVVSEALASIKVIEANSVFQAVRGILSKFAPKPKV